MTLGTDFHRRLEQILSCPTAPFDEGLVHASIRETVRRTQGLRASEDADGNLLVTYGRGRPGLVFACHTDHPALRAEGDGTATVLGGMPPHPLEASMLVGARLRSFDPDGPRAQVTRILSSKRPMRVRLRAAGKLRKGQSLILDLPDLRLSGGRLQARVVDDLVAAAACLTLFDRLRRARYRGTVGALFTRAEEVGFGGALGWVRNTRLPRSTTIVNLEMSKALPHTPFGAGPILRVGDRSTIFDADVSLELETVARELAGGSPSFRYQRALMDGGGCEATIYAGAGFRAGALCLPLGNTHNHSPRGGMKMEYVDQADAENLVCWMTAYTRQHGKLDPVRLRKRLHEALWRRSRATLKRTARRVKES